jgi:hypothetical protein
MKGALNDAWSTHSIGQRIKVVACDRVKGCVTATITILLM